MNTLTSAARAAQIALLDENQGTDEERLDVIAGRFAEAFRRRLHGTGGVCVIIPPVIARQRLDAAAAAERAAG